MYNVIDMCQPCNNNKIIKMSEDEIIDNYCDRENCGSSQCFCRNAIVVFDNKWENIYDFAEELRDKSSGEGFIYFPEIKKYLTPNLKDGREIVFKEYFNRNNFKLYINEKKIYYNIQDDHIVCENRDLPELTFSVKKNILHGSCDKINYYPIFYNKRKNLYLNTETDQGLIVEFKKI